MVGCTRFVIVLVWLSVAIESTQCAANVLWCICQGCGSQLVRRKNT